MAKISTTLTWGPDGVSANVDTNFDGKPSDIILMLSQMVMVYSQEIKTDPETLLLAMRLGIETLEKTTQTHTAVNVSPNSMKAEAALKGETEDV